MDEQKQKVTLAIASRIRFFRRSKDFSQEEIAFRAGLNTAYFGQVERAIKCPTVDTLYKIAGALEIPLFELVRFEEPLSSHADNMQLDILMERVPIEKRNKVYKIIDQLTALYLPDS